MLFAFTVAIISDISIIQCPCIFRYTLSSSILFKSSENHSSLIARNRKNVDFPAPCPPTKHTIISNLHPGSYTLEIAANINNFIISFV